MRLNVGCGADIRDGWVNVDHAPEAGAVLGDAANLGRSNGGLRLLEMGLMLDPYSYLRVGDGEAEQVLLAHVLHQFTVEWTTAGDGAVQVLGEALRVLRPGGELIVVEPDVLGVVGDYDSPLADGTEGDPRGMLARLIPDDDEPTMDGKLLRWVTWHGTRRSLWAPSSLTELLLRVGFAAAGALPLRSPEHREWAGDRWRESFTVTARKAPEPEGVVL